MRVSTDEANSLRACHHGTILTMNSFVSTSLNSEVALMYLGTDPDRDVMLEIFVHKTLLDSDSLPFADIRAVSTFSDEQEVLLPMGTTLQVQSVTISSQTKNMCVQVRLCYEEDAAMKELKTYFLKNQLRYGQDESFYMNILVGFLPMTMDDPEQIKKYIKLIKPNTENFMTKMTYCLNQIANISKAVANMDEIDVSRKTLMICFQTIAELMQDLEHNPSTPNYLRDSLSSIGNSFSSFLSVQNFDEFIKNPKQLGHLLSLVSVAENIITSLSIPSSHPCSSTMPMFKGLLEHLQDNHEEALKHLETGCSSSFIAENNTIQRFAKIFMAKSAAALGDADRSVRILEDLHTSTKPEVHGLLELARHHRNIGDMPMAITYYRSVIEECNLPPNSIAIVEAYNSIGDAFGKLNDNELALSNYYRARQLLLQHHSLHIHF